MASFVSGQDEPNRALWLATRAGKMEPSCPLGTTRCIPQAKFHQKPYNKFFIDQVCLVKMAGYWPRSFFASLWTSTSSRSINTQKKNLANIQPSWPHTWSITHTYLSAEAHRPALISILLEVFLLFFPKPEEFVEVQLPNNAPAPRFKSVCCCLAFPPPWVAGPSQGIHSYLLFNTQCHCSLSALNHWLQS